jgi:hypothetical protein
MLAEKQKNHVNAVILNLTSKKRENAEESCSLARDS